MFGFLCRLADNNKHCKGIPNIHDVKNTYNLCLEILADLLTTASSLQCCTAREYQTYMVSNAIVDYDWRSVQTCWQQQALNEHSKHTYLQTYDEIVPGDSIADSLITSRTAMTFQTYITTKNLWAMWEIPCRLADNNKCCKENIKHTYLQKHLISYELCVDVYACEPQYYV